MTLSNTFTNPNPSVSVASVTAPTTTTTTTTTTFHPQSYTTTSHGHGMNVNGVNGGGMTSVNVNGVNVNPTTTVTSFRPRQMQLSTPNIFANTALRRGKWTAVSSYNRYIFRMILEWIVLVIYFVIIYNSLTIESSFLSLYPDHNTLRFCRMKNDLLMHSLQNLKKELYSTVKMAAHSVLTYHVNSIVHQCVSPRNMQENL